MWQYFTCAVFGVAGVAAGWFASAWVLQRRIDVLQLQLKVLRQTLHANSDQARRQIGQLQAELASRPPAPQPAAEDRAVDIRRKPAAPDSGVAHEDGFAQTAVIGDHFPKTIFMR